jgi:hypothetical protein
MRRRYGDEILLLHSFEDLLDQLLHATFRLHLLELQLHFFVEQITFEQRVANCFLQRLHRAIVVAHLVKARELILESALQQEVGERIHQVVHAEFVSKGGNVFGIADAFHKNGRQTPDARSARLRVRRLASDV